MTIKTNTVIFNPDYKSKIIAYVKKLPIHDSYKEEIIDADFIDAILPIYTKYPSLFSEAFLITDNIDLINVAGFLYHRSIIYLDKLLDNQSQKTDATILISICQEESVKILATIYPLESIFWQIWNKRRGEYLKAYHIDNVSHKIDSYEDFEELADLKSAFGKISIDCLYILSSDKDRTLYEALLRSHKYYYCALQILDDINDLREDAEKGQFNIALYELKSELKARGVQMEALTPDETSKYLFVFGVAVKLFDKSLYYLQEAQACIVNYKGLGEWICEIERLINISITKKLNVQAFLKMSKVQIGLSNTQTPATNLMHSISKATDYILKMQNADGSFNEYFNEAGMSDVWATSFIASYLGQKNVGLSQTFKTSLHKATEFLITNSSTDDGLWGYNKEWIPDSDSSTFAQMAIYLVKGSLCTDKLEAWLKYQGKDGGFSTYNSADHILSSLNRVAEKDSVIGWLSSHVCVSAAAFYFLTQIADTSENLRSLNDYLKKTVNAPNEWGAYWWSSSIYTSSFMIKSFQYVYDLELRNLINRSAQSVLYSQNQNGSFGDDYTKDSAFYTALVIDSICENDAMYNQAKQQINNAVRWLLSNQMSDGSWLSTNPMIIPAPNILDPSKLKSWPVDTKGVNIRAKEFSRLFTTAVSLSALSKFDYVSTIN